MADQLPPGKLQQILSIGEGNPAALSISCKLYHIGASDNYDYFDALQRLDIKGVNLWILYKNECDQSDDRLIEVIKSKITELESS